jgi:hypothetical protein
MKKVANVRLQQSCRGLKAQPFAGDNASFVAGAALFVDVGTAGF